MNLKIRTREQEAYREVPIFLARGVGLALLLGHRLSADLDWFTPRRFDAAVLQKRLEQLPERPNTDNRYSRPF
jgi:hypothetical protein